MRGFYEPHRLGPWSLRLMQVNQAAEDNLRAMEERRLMQQRQRDATLQLERECNEKSYMERIARSLV